MSIRRSEAHPLGVAFATSDNKVPIILGRNHAYDAIPYRDGIFALYKTTGSFVGFYPYEVLIDPAAMKAFAPGTAYMDGYWTAEKGMQVRECILAYMPENPNQLPQDVGHDILVEG